MKKLFMTCMPFKFSENDIRALVNPHGQIRSIQIHSDMENATFERYAIIEIDVQNLNQLLNEVDGKHMGNRVIQLMEVLHG